MVVCLFGLKDGFPREPGGVKRSSVQEIQARVSLF